MFVLNSNRAPNTSCYLVVNLQVCVWVINFVSFRCGCLEHVLTDVRPSSYKSPPRGFPGTPLVWLRELLWGSIFISLLFSQAISPGHGVRRHLSVTVKLSVVCASVWCASGCLSGTRCMSHECPKDNPWSRWWQNELRRWMFSQHRTISSQLLWLIRWIAVSEC